MKDWQKLPGKNRSVSINPWREEACRLSSQNPGAVLEMSDQFNMYRLPASPTLLISVWSNSCRDHRYKWLKIKILCFCLGFILDFLPSKGWIAIFLVRSSWVCLRHQEKDFWQENKANTDFTNNYSSLAFHCLCMSLGSQKNHLVFNALFNFENNLWLHACLSALEKLSGD